MHVSFRGLLYPGGGGCILLLEEERRNESRVGGGGGTKQMSEETVADGPFGRMANREGFRGISAAGEGGEG